jgi:hypothetical protein
MSDLDELVKKQNEFAAAAEKMASETDPKVLEQMTAALTERAAAIGRMAKNIAAANTPESESTGLATTVQLTKEQRQRITEKTGIGIESIVVHDTRERKYSKEMDKVSPREIEKIATQQAAEMKLEVEAKAAVETLLKQLRSYERPELEEIIEKLARDPLIVIGRGKK